MRLILILCLAMFSFITIVAQEEEKESQEKTSKEIATDKVLKSTGFDPQWDYEMIARGGTQKQSKRFSLVYDSIEAEQLEIFITDLEGNIVETFWSDEPEETGLFVTFSISKKPLKEGIYYLNVVADGRTREASRIEVE